MMIVYVLAALFDNVGKGNYCHLYDVPTSAVRFFNVYGPNQNPNSPYSGVISILWNLLIFTLIKSFVFRKIIFYRVGSFN
ncbi:hypothetical protein EFM1CSP_19285 [Enterococcus faecium]|nr:hypothetical protein EFM1CSP_19285 [Enterococcus faecium]